MIGVSTNELDFIEEENSYEAICSLVDNAKKESASSFNSDSEMLEAFERLTELREKIQNNSFDKFSLDSKSKKKIVQLEKLKTKMFHLCFKKTKKTSLCEYLNTFKLKNLELEILICIIFHRLGFSKERSSQIDGDDILNLVCHSVGDRLRGMSVLGDTGKLIKSELIFPTDDDDELIDRDFILNPEVEDKLLAGKGNKSDWVLKKEKNLLEKLPVFVSLAEKKVEIVNSLNRGRGRKADFFKIERAFDRRERGILESISKNPNWKIAKFAKKFNRERSSTLIWILVLMAKELGQINSDASIFKGKGLTAVLASKPNQGNRWFSFLKSESILIKGKIIQPCGGIAELVEDDDDSISETEYELTPEALDELGIKKQLLKKRSADEGVRKAKMKFSQLALSNETIQSLKVAAVQSANANTLFKTWGLGESFSYGVGTTVLFYGPPGVGKTASAEALAHKLKKPILVADYAKIQNCFVGQTEKNIVKTFREAKMNDAVLFWDEADAMFYDRDSASRNFEVRDVNVLLQELEKFEGVCILSTNRQVTMDAALERRISVKIKFDSPSEEVRRELWRKILPKKLPLHKDVSIEKLSKVELTGGEIKNIVLNASRIAILRGKRVRIMVDDFEQAIDLETKGRWKKQNTSMGFASRK